MRFLIVAAVLACASAVPNGAWLAGSYSAGLAGSWAGAHAAPLALAAAPLGTISHGDIQGAAIDAHVVASDHTRAAVDSANQIRDQVAENQGKAINAAESHAWQAVNAAQTVAAAVDGHAAGVAPVAARQLAGHVAPVAAYGASVAAYGAPVAAYAAPAFVAPAVASYAAPAVASYAAPALAAHVAAPVVASTYTIPASQSISTQSLSQTHPAPVAHGYIAQGYGIHGHAW